MTSPFPQITSPPQAQAEVIVNEALEALAHQAVYAKNALATTGLTWGYLGGRWGGFPITAGALTLSASATNYIVVAVATGVISASTSGTNWDDAANYVRVYKVTTGTSAVTAEEDHRAGPGGVHGGSGSSGVGGSVTQVIAIACSDETTELTTGTAKVAFRMPFAFTLTAVRASVSTAPTGTGNLTVDINESGATILSTKLTFDASEKTTTTAATAAVISDSSLADDAEITVDIDAVSGTVKGAGLKVYLIGAPT